MRFFTPAECASWCKQQQIKLGDRGKPNRDTRLQHTLRCKFPSTFTQFLWFSRLIEGALQPRQDCLVWITAWGIFPSAENYHLYYRLRESYHDFRLLDEAPGHFCLGHERPDVATLIYLCVLFAWDAYLLPTVGYGRAFISHDEFVRLEFSDKTQFEKTNGSLQAGKVSILPDSV